MHFVSYRDMNEIFKKTEGENTLLSEKPIVKNPGIFEVVEPIEKSKIKIGKNNKTDGFYKIVISKLNEDRTPGPVARITEGELMCPMTYNIGSETGILYLILLPNVGTSSFTSDNVDDLLFIEIELEVFKFEKFPENLNETLRRTDILEIERNGFRDEKILISGEIQLEGEVSVQGGNVVIEARQEKKKKTSYVKMVLTRRPLNSRWITTFKQVLFLLPN